MGILATAPKIVVVESESNITIFGAVFHTEK